MDEDVLQALIVIVTTLSSHNLDSSCRSTYL